MVGMSGGLSAVVDAGREHAGAGIPEMDHGYVMPFGWGLLGGTLRGEEVLDVPDDAGQEAK